LSATLVEQPQRLVDADLAVGDRTDLTYQNVKSLC
jgi:hypothetical protein